MSVAMLFLVAQSSPPPPVTDLPGVLGAVAAVGVCVLGVWLARHGSADRTHVAYALRRGTLSEPLVQARNAWLALLPDDGTPIDAATRQDHEPQHLAAIGANYTLALAFAPLALLLGLLATLFSFGGVRPAFQSFPLVVAILAGVGLVVWVTKQRYDHDRVARLLLQWLDAQAEQERQTRLTARTRLQQEVAALQQQLAQARSERDQALASSARFSPRNASPGVEQPDDPMTQRGLVGPSANSPQTPIKEFDSTETKPSGGHFVDLP